MQTPSSCPVEFSLLVREAFTTRLHACPSAAVQHIHLFICVPGGYKASRVRPGKFLAIVQCRCVTQSLDVNAQGQLHSRSEQTTQLSTRNRASDQAGPANVLIKYIVPPNVQQEFIEVFQEVKDGQCSTPAAFAVLQYMYRMKGLL